MTALENRVRVTLREMSAEAQPVDFLLRLDGAPARTGRNGHLRLLAAAAVVAVIAVVVAATLVVTRPERSGLVEPVERPPQVFRLSGETAIAPGRAQLVVYSAQLSEGQGTAHVQSSTAGRSTTLATTEWVPAVYSQQLSQDGTRVIRQYNFSGDPRLEIVNLATGSTNRLGGYLGYCPRLSPDNRTVAVFGYDAKGMVFLDARTGRVLPSSPRGLDPEADCPGMGWSPDGTLFVAGGRKGSVVVDEAGRRVQRIPDRSAVNSAMSWAPDGQSILMYDWKAARNVIRDLADGSETVLDRPAGAVRPLGWAGSKVVWLVGQPGDQRLVTTDRTGADRRPWMRLDVGRLAVETVEWSSDLSGRPTAGH